MKPIFTSILILFLFSCAQETSSNDKNTQEKPTNLYVTDNKEIIGNWTMCSSFGNDMMTQFMFVPRLHF